MTEHLPECWAKHESDPPAWCICDELRACEARVIGAAVQRVKALAVNPYYCEDQWYGAETHLVTSEVITAVKGDQT